MQLEVISWFGSDDTGLSSKTIAIAGTGADRPYLGWSYPHDPADFGRCERLLRRIPGLRKPAFDRLKTEGGEAWIRLIFRWDEIATVMEDEVGIDWSKARRAPRTYELINTIV